ncbi:hypothetical protein GOBAR_AA12038 [Gossypium barbadense]|uniref:Uncharacterized protein n=1 Tax=Gossypium barbadense TaxID=3634 RepID=A0A2P5XZ77_GOSBA|nr:hypothetical protein GOBAR_AA12038 [Gossypium barbadense]
MSLNEAHESFLSNSIGPVHEDRRLQIKEPDEWRTLKPRTPDKLKLGQNESDISLNQLKVGDKVLLDVANPHIVTTTLNEEIPLTVLSIFPFGTVEVSHPKFSTFKVNNTRLLMSSRGKKTVIPTSKKRKGASSSTGPTMEIRHPLLQFPRGLQEKLFQIVRARPLIMGRCIDSATIEQVQMADAIRALLTTEPWELFFGIIEPTYLELTMELCSTFHLQTVITRYDDPGTPLQDISSPTILEVFTRYFSSHDYREVREHWRRQHPRHLLLMVHVARARYRPCLFYRPCDSAPDGAASEEGHLHWPLRDSAGATHFGLLNTAAQESSLTLIGQMSPQGISSMLRMRMIKRHRGTYPPQYRLAQSTEEEAYEDNPDDVPPQHEGPPTQPPPPSRLVHTAALYADISERLT